MITLYHGSYMSVPSPLTGVGRRELDFGPGFYVTNLREQAERWARRVCVIRAVDTPTLSSYEFDETLLPANVPFIIIDMVVASTLMSMGMMMLPPTTISMPFKILLFVLADGWNLVIGNLVKTFY